MYRTTTSWLSTITKLGFKRRHRRGAAHSRAASGFLRRLAVESLEDRRMLSTVVNDAEPNNTIATAVPMTTLGSGVGDENLNTVISTITVNTDPIDYFSVDLAAGDVLGVSLRAATGQFKILTLRDSANTILMQTTQRINRYAPDSSPLLDGLASMAWQAPAAGTYFVSIEFSPIFLVPGSGTYTLDVQVERPAIESKSYGTSQILFLDFDGATVDKSTFKLGNYTGSATLSPLASFLSNWGLNPTDENALIDAVIAEVKENLYDDVVAQGATYNGDFLTSATPGEFNLEIRNSRDHGDLTGLPNVTRVVVGGTLTEFFGSSSSTLMGIAESYDVGNFDLEESAVVFLDKLSSPTGQLNSLTLAGGATKIDLVATALGNVASHEAGHLFGVLDTVQSNFLTPSTPRSVSDLWVDSASGSLLDTVGLVGSVWGDNEIDVDLNTEMVFPALPGVSYSPGSFAATGTQSGIARLSYALATGRHPVVSTLVDELDSDYSIGDLSLREALSLAAATSFSETIQFDPMLFSSGPATITLSGSLGQLVINSNVDIVGPSDNQLTISRAGSGRILQVDANVAATIRDMSIAGGGDAGILGGGILNRGKLTLEGVVVRNNLGNQGGAIYQEGANAALHLIDSTIRDNIAVVRGGAIHATGGSVEIVSSTISNNNASLYTGGLSLMGSASTPVSLSMINSTVSTNLSGGIMFFGGAASGTAAITNSTITLNTAPYQFPGQPQDSGGVLSFGQVVLHNTIVAANAAGDIKGTFSSVSSHNLIGEVRSTVNLIHGTNGNMVGTQASPINASLTALGSFGGATRTHALLSTSLALNAGSSTLAAGLPFDQRGDGFARISGSAVDIGAVEGTSGSLLTVDTLVDESDGNFAAGDFSLREALAMAQTIAATNTIAFAPSLTSGGPATITLAYDGPDSGTGADQLTVDSNVAIEGPGADLLTIDADSDSRVLLVVSGVNASVSGLTLTGGAEYEGGAIYSAGNLSLKGIAIEGNAAYVGGGIYQTGGSLDVVGSTISENYSGSHGGGIYINSSTDVSIINSTISSNSAVHSSGGVFVNGASSNVTLAHDTITNNSVSQSTGGAGGLYSFQGTVTMTHTIVAGNFVNGVAKDVHLKITHADATYNLVGIGTIGNVTEGLLTNGTNYNLIGVTNPGLTALGYHGGTVKTHALLSSSVAIDAGDSAIENALEFDQRGENRIADGNEDENAVIDIGAFELAFDELYT